MPVETEIICEVFEAEKLIASPPSRLFHLKPIGIGTPLIESLTSYISRLANAHSVLPRTLVTDELLPNLQQSHLYKENQTVYDHLTTFWKRSAVLNGNCSTASTWVQIVEQLTQRDGLHLLTMLTFSKVLSCRGLVRRTLSWCPACYEEWREADDVIYQPLLWQLSAIIRCPRHSTPLLSRCPYAHCGRTLSPLDPRFQAGYCTHCERWLGSSSRLETSQPFSRDQLERLAWFEQAVGDLLVAASKFSATSWRPEAIGTLISTHVESAMEGNFSEFARSVGFHRRTVWEWAQGSQIPQLEALLRICSYFEISPVHLLTGNFQEVSQIRQNTQERVSIKEQQKREFRKFDTERLRDALEQVLYSQEYPPPSMQKVAQDLNYDQSHLRKHFPDICHAISIRYLAFLQEQRLDRIHRTCSEVWEIMRSLYNIGHSTSGRQVGKMLKKRGVLKEKAIGKFLKEILHEYRHIYKHQHD